MSVQHNRTHFCGAALITVQWALTSGQCASKYFDFSVRAGSNYTSKDGELYDVEKILIHPNFNNETFDSDLALIKLTENVTVDYGMPTRLPVFNSTVGNRTVANITGWGHNSTDPNNIPEILQFVQVSILNDETCKKQYTGKKITQNMFCAGQINGNRTSCSGDYGGPAIVQFYLAGIQSWGGNCADGTHPTVFVKTSEFVPWIEATMSRE